MDNTVVFNLNTENADRYLDNLFEQYKLDPNSIDESWKQFFMGLEFASNKDQGSDSCASNTPLGANDLQVLKLIDSYRSYGHLKAKLDPIGKTKSIGMAFMQNMDNFFNTGLGKSLLEQNDILFPWATKEICLDANLPPNLKNILEKLQQTYCSQIGVEYMHIQDPVKRSWVQEKIEKFYGKKNYDLERKTKILTKLNQACVFENFLHTKYIGQKRFSLEGSENSIVAIDAINNLASKLGVKEVIIGMAHRGRLNILANIMGKSYEEIFSEFEGKKAKAKFGDGDVKYHLGHSSVIQTENDQELLLYLMPNPSHLEAAGPVVQGFTRAKGEIIYKGDFTKILPIQIHGDAAVAGQGVVYETLQMSLLEGYQTAGTIHFVINNQVGFTTDPYESRSSTYCTNIAKMLDCPIFHVNGDSSEDVVFVSELACEFRQTFKHDVFVDMISYRKYGHNEGDEPRYTQPSLYESIDAHPDARQIYSKQLPDSQLAEKMQQDFKNLLQDRLNKIKQESAPVFTQKVDLEWKMLRESQPSDFLQSPSTHIDKNILHDIVKKLSLIPENFSPIAKAKKVVIERIKMFESDSIDWALGELLAYATLLVEGKCLRLSGQDVLRGTFSHRHASIVDEKTNERYCHLSNIAPNKHQVQIFNSLLSEYAVLGFEYGHSLASPNRLCIWEAQFGDFSNTAQTIIDQFISSGESKWHTHSGITLLLPHGYEGQGPEHSSARPERYLQLCAEFNMIVTCPTTPHQFFHLIRRQMAYEFRKPLIVFTPKSLLRHPECISKVESFTQGKFEEFIDDSKFSQLSNKEKEKICRVILCTGKVYYDLLDYQRKNSIDDIAIVRLEQLHPLPFERLDACLKSYSNAKFYWVQEEPKNMGFWNYMLRKLDYYNLTLLSRKSSASTASGYLKVHQKEQVDLVTMAFSK